MTRTLANFRYSGRYFSIHSAVRNDRSYSFYDLVCRTPTHPREPLEAAMMTHDQLKKLKQTTGLSYEGNYSIDRSVSDEERIAKVFGGRIKGEIRQSSSRITRGEPQVIAGITVPNKPSQPDNCCMSGCINCVWEIFNEDLKYWNQKRAEAAKKLRAQGGRWPEDFDAPIKLLHPDNLPLSVKNNAKSTVHNSGNDPWGDIPVSIKVFAEVEHKLKQKRLQNESLRK